MRVLAAFAATVVLAWQGAVAYGQQVQSKPGLLPYTPTRIEWLALVVNAQLRQDATVDNPFSLSVVQSDHETLLIFVRYHPKTDREIMNRSIETAREVIRITTNSYGWSKWVKVRELVEMANPKSQ